MTDARRTTYPHADVEAAFRRYWELGAVGEDWNAWVDECSTDDVTYIEHVLGNMSGREEVRSWINRIMAQYRSIYTVYGWHQIGEDGRVVVYMQNRRDNPDPDGGPIDFPGITVLQYGGDGRFSLEEDFWSYPGAMDAASRYAEACEAHDPDFERKGTRRDWGDGPAWTIGEPTYAQSRGGRRQS